MRWGLSHITSFVFKASPNIHANESKAGGSSSLRVSHRVSCEGVLVFSLHGFTPPPPPSDGRTWNI